MYSETVLNIALPQLSLAFGVDVSVTQWLVVGYMLVIGVVLPFADLLMKWFSARKLTLFALGAFLVGAIVSAAAPRLPSRSSRCAPPWARSPILSSIRTRCSFPWSSIKIPSTFF